MLSADLENNSNYQADLIFVSEKWIVWLYCICILYTESVCDADE